MPESKPPSDVRHLVNRLKLRHLALLSHLERDPNVARSAQRMNLSQPTASKLLREIEDIFGVLLFTRNRRGLLPTPVGRAMTRRASVRLEEMRATHEELLSTVQGASSRLRIGLFPVAVPRLFVALREHLLERWPGVVILINEGAENSLLAALSAGELDCVLGRVVAERMTPDLRHEVLYREPTVIVCGPDHPIRKARKHQRLPLLSTSEWLLPSPGGPSYNLVGALLAMAGHPMPRVSIESISVFVTSELLQRSRLLSVMPLSVAESYARRGEIAIVPVQLPEANYPVGIMFRKETARSTLVRSVIDAAHEVAKRIAPQG